MPFRSTICLICLLCVAVGALISPVLAAEEAWKEVAKRSGAFADSTTGGGRAKSTSAVTGPFGFEVKGKLVRLTWSTETAGRNPDFRIDLEKLVPQNNGRDRWQRVAVMGRTHDTTKDGKVLESGPGNYRYSVIGHAMKYDILIESPGK